MAKLSKGISHLDMDPYQAPNSQVIPETPQPFQKSSTATAALILGILTYVIGGLFTAIPAVICGHLACSEIKKNPNLQGRGSAIAGLILGYIAIVITVLVLVFVMVMFAKANERLLQEDFNTTEPEQVELKDSQISQ